MNESHVSIQGDFEISREETDQMVAIAHKQPGCFGARMTGGGCGVALLENTRWKASWI